MATLSEWLSGKTRGGKQLPIAKVNAYRDRHGIPPLERTSPAVPPQQEIRRPVQMPVRRGVGTHLKLLLKELGVNSDLCGEGCGSFAAAMDGWGIEGCRQNREAILERLRQRYKETSWKTTLNAAWQTVVSGKVFGMNVLHPLDWLVDEAIRRAEKDSRPVAPVSVIVTTHNYARFLDECLASIDASTHKPAELIVIDDASDDDPASVCKARGVRCERVDFRSVYRSRGYGLSLTSSPYVAFVDADDKLSPGYIESGLAQFTRDTIGVVNSNLQHFGDSEQLRQLSPCDIDRENYIHAGAIVRRVALEQSRAYDETEPVGNTRADWFVWRRVLSQGWQVAHNPEPYQYRQHGEAMHHADTRLTYRQLRDIDRETVQVIIPFSGRDRFFDRLTEWVETQAWPRIEVMAIDTSSDTEFRLRLRTWLATLKVASQYVPMPPSDGLADRQRSNSPETFRAVQLAMSRIYGEVRKRVSHPFIMIVEDDVLPPPDAISSLVDGFDSPSVAAVSGVVRSRYEENYIAWRAGLELVKSDGAGIEDIEGSGFGCLLIRRTALQSVPIHHGGKTGNYDQSFPVDIGGGWRWKINWNVRCLHGTNKAPQQPV